MRDIDREPDIKKIVVEREDTRTVNRTQELNKMLKDPDKIKDLKGLLDAVRDYAPRDGKSTDKVLASVRDTTNSMQIDLEQSLKGEDRLAREPEKEPDRQPEKDGRERAPERAADILEREKAADRQLNYAIDKMCELYNRNRIEIREIAPKQGEIGVPLKDVDMAHRMGYANNALAETLHEALSKRNEEIMKASLDCDYKLAESAFQKYADGRDKEVTPDERDNLELATYLRSPSRGIPDKDVPLSQLANERASARTELRVPEVSIYRGALNTHNLRSAALTIDSREEDVIRLKENYRAAYRQEKDDLRAEFKGDSKRFERIYQGGFKCDNERYGEYKAKRDAIESKWVDDFRSLSAEYKTVLDERLERISASQSKFDERIVKSLKLMADNDIPLDKDEKKYLQAYSEIDNLREEHSLRMHEFYAHPIEEREGEGLAREVPKAADRELDNILKSKVRNEEQAHALFTRIERFLDKTVPYDSVKDSLMRDLKKTTDVSRNESPTERFKDILEREKSDGNRSTLEMRRDAERAYDALKHLMSDKGYFTSSELLKVSMTRRIFDERGTGLSDDIRSERDYRELEKTSSKFSLAEDRYNRRAEALERAKSAVLKPITSLLERTKEKLPEKLERKIVTAPLSRDDDRYDKRQENLKTLIKDKLFDMREAARDKAANGIDRMKATVSDLRNDGWRTWMANQLRNASDKLIEYENSRYKPEHAK